MLHLKGKSKIILQVRPNSSVEKRSEVLMEWYRKELYPVADKLMAKWQKKIGVQG